MKTAFDRKPELTRLHWGVLGAMLIALTAGIAFTIGTARAENSRMRAQLLSQSRLAQSAVNWRRIENLSGTEKDLVSPDYLRLKEQLTLMRSAHPQCRFIHVIGRKPDGAVFFFVDSEPPSSPDYSPPGQVLAEVSDTCRKVFVTGREVTEGPVADHLGTWISGFIPVMDPVTKQCVAILCMDITARDWTWQIAMHCMMPITVTLLIVILLAAFIVLHGRVLREKRHEEASEAVLRATEDRYRALFEGSSDAVMILGDGRFMDCNTATLKMFGYDSKEEFSALHPADVSPPRQSAEVDSRTAADQHIAAALTHGIDRFEWTHRRRNGEDFPAEVWLTALQMGERRVLQATVRDITKRKRVEEERDIMRLRQGEINLLQQALLAPMPLDRKIKSITDGIVRIFGSDFCRIWLIRPGDLCEQGCIHAEVKEGPHVCRNRDRCLHLLASSGRYTHTDKGHRRVPFGCYKIGLIASGEEHKFITNDVQNDPRVHNHEWARDLGLVSFTGYQLQVPGGKTLGVLATFVKHPIAPAEDAMLDGLSSTVAHVIQQAAAEEALARAAAEWQETFDAIDAYVVIIDADRCVIHANRAFREAFPGREVTGEHCFGLIHGAAEVPASCAACAVFLTGKPVQVELQEPHLGNRWFDVSAFPLKDGTGTVMRIVHILRDITARKRIETAMHESEEQFRMLSEHSPIGISLVRPDMTYEYVNPFFTRMFGYSVANIVDRNTWYEKAYPDPVYREHVQTAWKADFAERDGFWRMQAETFTVRCKDGTDKMIRVNGVVLPDNRVLMTHEDVTQLVSSQKALRVAKESAETANAAKSSFLANMSHEIRTPMNAILGFADILSGQVENPAHKEFLAAITASGKTLLGLINDILDLSKIEAGKLKLEYSAVNPFAIFSDIQQIFTLETKRKGINFQVEIDPELPAALILDEVRLRQILLNLVGNAVKFTSSGSITLSAAKRFRHPDHSALEFVFSVKDTGVGIPFDQQEQIFEVFHQQTGQSRAQYGGTGLGLAICKRLVEAMGGRITVASTVGQGSTFQVVLDNISVAAAPSSAKTQAAPVGSAFEFAPARILVVDDIKLNRLLLQQFLDNPVFTLDEAENGQEALEIIRRHRPDLIMLDMRMPVMDGTELIRRLKTDATLATIPVIVVSASAMPEEEAEAKAVGCDGYLRKPVQRDELLQEIFRFLKRRDK